jgi:hypothetical protein
MFTCYRILNSFVIGLWRTFNIYKGYIYIYMGYIHIYNVCKHWFIYTCPIKHKAGKAIKAIKARIKMHGGNLPFIILAFMAWTRTTLIYFVLLFAENQKLETAPMSRKAKTSKQNVKKISRPSDAIPLVSDI